MAAGIRSAIAPWFVLLATLATVASIGPRAGAEPHAQPDAGAEGKAVWRGKVESAVDGDTLRVRDADDKLQRVRILGIDAPENGQPFSGASMPRNLGRWIDKDPVSPWDWRAAEKARAKGRKRPERERVPEAPRP